MIASSRWIVPFMLLAIVGQIEGQKRGKPGGTPGRISNAAQVLQEVMSQPDKAIPEDLLAKARCVGVIPAIKNAAFIVGEEYGKGFVLCRSGAQWSPPAAIKIEGGSFGIGAGETDVIFLIMNTRGEERLFRNKFAIGGEASVAAGPVGRNATAQTDSMMHAEMLTYSRSRGVFAGLSLQGAILRPDDNANQELYAGSPSISDILNGKVKVTSETEPLSRALKALAK